MFSTLLITTFLTFINPMPALEQPISEAIKSAVATATRPEKDRSRDALRKPGEVLAFFGIKPQMKIIDLAAGLGYYTHILSHIAGPQGKVYAQNPPFVIERFVKDKLEKRVAEFKLDNVEILVSEFDEPNLPSQADAVLMVLFYHDTYWQKVDRKKMNKAIFDSLKPGGLFGIVDHSAAAGSGDRDVQTFHRIDAEMVKKEITQAGFLFEAQTTILQHPEDTRDWSFFKDIPNTRDRTDRFIFRFRKPQ